MARGENAEKNGHAGREYWKSRLTRHGDMPGRYTKQSTAKKERRESRRVEWIDNSSINLEAHCHRCGHSDRVGNFKKISGLSICPKCGSDSVSMEEK